MNFIISLIVTGIVSFVTPSMILSLINGLIEFFDPIMAKRGFIQRQMWGLFKAQMSSPMIGKEIESFLADTETRLAQVKAEQRLS